MWREAVSRYIKSEMSARGIRYQELSDKLNYEGVSQSADNLRNKINKGILGADLLVQILICMNVEQLDMHRMEDILRQIKKTRSEERE